MQKLRYTLGLPVLEVETGAQLGEISEAVLDIENAIVCGFIINGAKGFAAENLIAFKDIHSLGHDAIMINNHQVIRQLDTMNFVNSAHSLRDLFDKQIFTDSGLCLGVLADIVFDNITGEIKWYQISDSIISDLLYGRKMMPLPQVQVIGQDKVIVPETMIKLLHGEGETLEM